MSNTIELSPETCIDLLKRYADLGFSRTGCITIREGAAVHKYFRLLKKQETDENLSEENLFKVIFKVLDVFNTNKAFTLDDAAVIDKIMSYIEENVFNKTQEAPVQEQTQTEKIREL